MEQEVSNKEFPSQDFRWQCPNCKFLLGFIDRNCETVRLKYRDFYVTVKGGEVACTCRRCGKVAVLTQQPENNLEKEVFDNGVQRSQL